MRKIEIIDSSSLPNEDLFSLEFNENLIQNNIDKLTNILPTNLPMICQPNKWSDTEYGGYLNNKIEKNNLIKGIGINNDHRIYNLNKLYDAINYLNSIKFKVNKEVLDYIFKIQEIIFKNYYQLEGNLINDKIN